MMFHLCADCVEGPILAEIGTTLSFGKICPHGGNGNAFFGAFLFMTAILPFGMDGCILQLSDFPTDSFMCGITG